MNRRLKRRAPMGRLRNLTHHAREKLHSWFREQDGLITFVEVSKRIEREFGFRVSTSTLSAYYRENYEQIINPSGSEAAKITSEPTTIVVRIKVPAGCHVDVSSEVIAPAEGGQA